MSQFFTDVLTASLYGSIVIFLVVLLRLILKRTPKSVICLLWLLAGLRLLLPFEIESRVSLQPDLEIIQPQPTISVQTPMTPDGTGLSQLPEQDVTLTPDTPDMVIRSVDYWEIGTIIWLSGMFLLAICSLVSYLRLKRQVGEAIRVEDNIWEVCSQDTAFVLGIFRPRIYIPANISAKNRHFVVAHERSHIARRDHWYKPIGYLILSIHWFNPLVWLAYVLLCRDIEMACDEQVIRTMNTEQRKAYSSALLSCSTRRRGVTACPVAFGEGSIRQRIIGVLNYRKPGFWVILIAIVAVIFVIVCFMTAPVAEEPPDGIASPPPPENAEELEQWVRDALSDSQSSDHYHFSSEAEFKVNEFLTTEIYMTDENWTHIQTRQGVQEVRTYRDGIGEFQQNTAGWTMLDQAQDIPSHWLLTTDWDTTDISVLQYQQLNSGHKIECQVNLSITVGEETAPDFWLRVELNDQQQLRALTMRACVDEVQGGKPVSRQLMEENLNIHTSTPAEITVMQKIDQCRMALAKWRSHDSYHLSVDRKAEGDSYPGGSFREEYWKSGSDWMKLGLLEDMALDSQEVPVTASYWYAEHDDIKISRSIVTTGDTVKHSGWKKDDFSTTAVFTPWPMVVDWDAYSIQYHSYQAAMGEEMITLTLESEAGKAQEQASFYFGKDGKLSQIVHTYYELVEGVTGEDPDLIADKITDTICLLSTDADEICDTMEEQLTR